MGRRGLGQRDAVQHHCGTVGREECLGQEFMLSRILPLILALAKGNRDENTTLPSLLLSLSFERLWPARLLWVVFICAGKGRTAALGNAALLQLARGCSPASCPKSCPLQAEHDFSLTSSTIRKWLFKICRFYCNLSINLPVDFALTAPSLLETREFKCLKLLLYKPPSWCW